MNPPLAYSDVKNSYKNQLQEQSSPEFMQPEHIKSFTFLSKETSNKDDIKTGEKVLASQDSSPYRPPTLDSPDKMNTISTSINLKNDPSKNIKNNFMLVRTVEEISDGVKSERSSIKNVIINAGD